MQGKKKQKSESPKWMLTWIISWCSVCFMGRHAYSYIWYHWWRLKTWIQPSKFCEVVFQSWRPKYQSDQSARTCKNIARGHGLQTYFASGKLVSHISTHPADSTNQHNKNHLLGTKNLANCAYYIPPQGINISHLGKRKIIFKSGFWWDMLVPWRVNILNYIKFR